jgi:hypothetical protein
VFLLLCGIAQAATGEAQGVTDMLHCSLFRNSGLIKSLMVDCRARII